MEQEQHKKDKNKEWKKNQFPSLMVLWLLCCFVVAWHNEDIFWISLFIMAIALAPAFLTNAIGFWIAKKGEHFFLTFREKPLLWCGLGLIYFSGGLLLKNSVLLLIYWYLMWLPLFQNFAATLYYDCKMRWKVFSYILLTILVCVCYNVRGIIFTLGALQYASLKAMLDELFD